MRYVYYLVTVCLNSFLPLDRNVHVRDVVQNEVNQLLIPILPDELDERLRFQGFPELVRSQAVLGEGIVEVVQH